MDAYGKPAERSRLAAKAVDRAARERLAEAGHAVIEQVAEAHGSEAMRQARAIFELIERDDPGPFLEAFADYGPELLIARVHILPEIIEAARLTAGSSDDERAWEDVSASCASLAAAIPDLIVCRASRRDDARLSALARGLMSDEREGEAIAATLTPAEELLALMYAENPRGWAAGSQAAHRRLENARKRARRHLTSF